MKRILLLTVAGFPLYALAQTKPTADLKSLPVAAKTDTEQSGNETPTTLLTFKSEQAIPGFTAPIAIAEPLRCSSDGAVFLNTVLPPDFRNRLVSSYTDKATTQFNIPATANLENVHVLDFYPSERSLDYLVSASPKSNDGPLSTGTHKPTEFHNYILQLDRNGMFKRSVELPGRTQYLRLAILASGNLLLSGFDVANNIPRLLLVSPDGTVLRPLELPADLEKKDQLNQLQQKYQGAASLAGSQIFSQGTFTAQAGGVTYSLPGSSTILSITGDGTLREVKVETPAGYALNTLVGSDGQWIVRFKRANLPDQGSVDASPQSRNFLFYQVDPQDGSLIRELDLSQSQLTWMACAHDKRLIAFKTDEKSNFIPLKADIP